MNDLLKLIQGMVGTHLPVAALASLLPVLLPIAGDLVDGDPHLSDENILKIQNVLEDIKGEYL